VKASEAEHVVSVVKVKSWLNGVGKSPGEHAFEEVGCRQLSRLLFFLGLVLTPYWPPTFFRLRHPSRRTTTPPSTTGSNALEYDYRLFDAFTFVAEFGQHFVDVHLVKSNPNSYRLERASEWPPRRRKVFDR
jgi:hypothetical protein